MKVSTLVGSVRTLEKVDATTLKLSTAYKINKILAECKLAVQDFEQRRLELAKTHGELSEDGQMYNFTDESRVLFSEALQEILDDDVALDIKKIPYSELEDRLEVAPAEIQFVEWFIEGLEF